MPSDVVGEATGDSGKGCMLKKRRKAGILKSEACPNERRPEMKKENWRAAGSHQVKRTVMAGRPYIISFMASGERFDDPVSPPRCGLLVGVLKDG